MSGFTAWAPAVYPASNFWMSSFSTPPMNPIVPVWLFSAAAAPTRNEPCSSAKTSEATFGASTTASTMVKLTSGLAAATDVIESKNRKPLPCTSPAPLSTRPWRRSARSPSPVGVDSSNVMPSSADRLVERRSGGVVERLVATTGDVEGHADDGIALAGWCSLPAGASGRGRCRRASVPSGASVPAVASVPAGASVVALSSSSLPQAAAVKPSAAMTPTASSLLLLIMVSPSGCGPAVIRQMFTVTRKATKR